MGTVGQTFSSDIAIDDITYLSQSCGLTPIDAAPPGMTTSIRSTLSTANPGSFTSREFFLVIFFSAEKVC